MKIESRPGGKDIEVWQLARELTRKVYRLTKKPEFAKDYGLKKQIQDAAGSSMHNLDIKKYEERKATNREPRTVNPEPEWLQGRYHAD